MIATVRGHEGQAGAAIAEGPLPLSDELPTFRRLVGPRTLPLLWCIGIMAVAVRLIILPLGHWWDITTFYNTFIDLGHNHSPYATLDTLSHIAQSSGWGSGYEYYAYPPLTIYLYYPLAQLFVHLHPTATYFFPVSGAMAMPSLPLDFYALYKLPMWIADFVLAALLARMTGTVRSFRDYLLNPYVLLVSGAWTFDVLMALAVLCGLYWLQQGKLARAGIAFALGTLVKFIPIILIPTCLIYLFKKRRTFKEMGVFLVAYVVTALALVAPFLSGTLATIAFQGSRIGGGMNWQQVWVLWPFFPSLPPLPAVQDAVGAFGTPTLVIMLLIAYWRAYTGALSLNRMTIVTLLAFFLGSKIVNEQYALILFPLLYIEARRQGGIWRWFFHLFWILPLLFAIMRVPADRFLWPMYHTFFPASGRLISLTGDTGFEAPFIPWKHAIVDPYGMVLLGLAVFVLSAIMFAWPSQTVSIRLARERPRGKTSSAVSEELAISHAPHSVTAADSPSAYGPSRSDSMRSRPSVRLSQLARRYTQRAVIPLILLAGLIVVVSVHFTSEMRDAQAQQNAAQGLVTCTHGKLQMAFHRDDGAARPALTYGGVPLLSYMDWSSTITIDGVTQELWNNYHGYSIADNGCTIYSTTSGTGWQVVQVAHLIDDHTVQISYEFVARSAQGAPPPQQVQLEIVHVNPIWYQPAISGGTLTAQVLPKGATSNLPTQPVGTLTLSVSGTQVAPQAPMSLGGYHTTVGPAGASQSWANTVTTRYVLASPTLDELTPLGTEDVMFAPATASGTSPANFPVLPPTPSL